jgi:excisionase family DNA binding protein
VTDRLAAAVAELAEALREELRAEAATAAPLPPRLLNLDSTGALLGLGRSAVYTELQAGRLRSVKVGRRRLVPSSAITEFIAQKSNGRPATTLGDRPNPSGVLREPLPTG